MRGWNWLYVYSSISNGNIGVLFSADMVDPWYRTRASGYGNNIADLTSLCYLSSSFSRVDHCCSDSDAPKGKVRLN